MSPISATTARGRAPIVTFDRASVLVLLDQALSGVSQREFLTRDEALKVLGAIVADISDSTLAATTTSIVDDAVASYDDTLLVGRSRITDPLLDLRLALVS